MNKLQSDRLIELLEYFEQRIIPPSNGHNTEDETTESVKVPETINDILEEMVTNGQLSHSQMQRLITAIRPILEENEKLKNANV